MMKQLSIAAFALVAIPGLAAAQQYAQPTNQTMPAQPSMQSQGAPMAQQPAQAQRGPVDPNGRPYVMSPPQPTPGDPGYGATAQRSAPPQAAPPMNSGNAYRSQAMASGDPGGTMRDEYGNLYNSRGDRIDRSGRILPPPVTPPGARALR